MGDAPATDRQLRAVQRAGSATRTVVLVVALAVAVIVTATARPTSAHADTTVHARWAHGALDATTPAADPGGVVDPSTNVTPDPAQPTAPTPTVPLLPVIEPPAIPAFETAPATTGQATPVAGGAGWAKADIRSAVRLGMFAPTLAAKPLSSITRGAFVVALAQLDRIRTEGGQPSVLGATAGTRSLPDASAGSLRARAVEAGWITPRKGRFAAGGPVTGDEVARGVVAAMGLQSSARIFAGKLAAAVPGARTNYLLRADQVYVRALGMRYNQLQGHEALEFGPTDAAKVADVAYMLVRGMDADGWRESSLRSSYESFELPALTAAQRSALATGVHQLGQPYVWGGESEGAQPEGHAGFDCSGFVWRMLNGAQVSGARATMRITQRTSETMSSTGRHIGVAGLRPGDVMFFHDPSTRKKTAKNNYHTGIYMGNGWVMHSSGGNGGPHIERMDGWLADQFTWARRVIR